MSLPQTGQDTSVLLEFMFRLGQAYLACGEQTAEVELLLRRVALAYGMGQTRVVALPTAIFITLHDKTAERVTLAEGPSQSLRLDQIAEVYRLGSDAQTAAMSPREGLDRLVELLRTQPRFGRWGALAGHMILAVGVAMVLMPTVANIVAAAVLGLLVGGLKMALQQRTLFAVPMPVVAATLVSAAVFYAADYGLPVDPLHMLVPPLVTFLPGGMLTLGMVELAYGDMVSGSSRLITGFVTLVLLAFGLAAGAALMGARPESLVYSATQFVKVPWASWAGVLVFCVGVYLHFSAPRNSLGWIIVVALSAIGAQRIAAALFGAEISGFFGMLVAVPASYLIQQRFGGPPSVVT
ncbi:MAG: threonine/serine exporter family protein, partial [Burkholderiaceae bacterium]|nr:threonine/serine exporter family protein [Burkholderiaceae bacterium]